ELSGSSIGRRLGTEGDHLNVVAGDEAEWIDPRLLDPGIRSVVPEIAIVPEALSGRDRKKGVPRLDDEFLVGIGRPFGSGIGHERRSVEGIGNRVSIRERSRAWLG